MKGFFFGSCLWMLALRSSLGQVALTSPTPTAATADSRYGLFGWLDHRSDYGAGAFPEPFRVDDSDLETGEARLDWLHTQGDNSKSDVVTAEIEKSFGLTTLEVEVPYERDRAGDITTQGMDNIDLGARHPLYQYVSPGGLVDSTFGVGIEVGVPTESALSKDTEWVPKIFDDLKVGNFTTQAIFGYSRLSGPGDDGGLANFEYGFVFGYTIPHEQLPVPGVLQTIPFFELIGETQLNKDDSGHNSLLGNAGLRFNFKALGRVQPRPGIGFVFPMNNGAREDTHWGVITSLVFEF